MLTFFPSPYPDELLYSVIARYHQRLGGPSFRSTVDSIFGSQSAGVAIDFPCRLKSLQQHLPHGTLNTPSKLINDNSLFPYYRRFLSPKRVQSIEAKMCDDHGNRIHTSIGMCASSVPQIEKLRFCTECVPEEHEQYGESYWHRSHQLFGVVKCHKHKCWLVESNLPVPRYGRNRCLKSLEEIYLQDRYSLEHESGSTHFDNIASSAHWLLNTCPDELHEANTLRKRYLWWLWRQNIVPNPFTLKIHKISEQLYDFYGESFLRYVCCDFLPSDQDTWVSNLLRKQRKMIHPLQHLLFIHFLGISPSTFFQFRDRPYFPFGRGPWPCLNPAAEHYHKRIISDCECDRVNNSGEPMGIFRCECGYVYGRTRHKDKDDDSYKREWVVSFGPVWEKELLRHIENNTSLRETARLLEVDVNTVKFNLERLTGPTIRVQEFSFDDTDIGRELILRRERWLENIEQHPDMNRKKLRRTAEADYAWLYRNDKKWLFAHLPAHIATSKRRELVNWPVRDAELSLQIASAVEQLKAKPGLPQRIGIRTIGNHLGVCSLFEKKLYKLPKCALMLNKLVDNDDSFICRRVSHAIRELRNEGKPLAPWRILEKAALRNTPTVQNVIMRQLESL